MDKTKLKRFKDFATSWQNELSKEIKTMSYEKDGKRYMKGKWKMENIFEMLDYLANEIEILKNEKRK